MSSRRLHLDQASPRPLASASRRSQSGDNAVLCPVGSAWERLDRLRRTLVERPFLPERGEDAFAFTFSAGLAAWPQDGAQASALLGCADRRLKAAKAAGGSRIVARDA